MYFLVQHLSSDVLMGKIIFIPTKLSSIFGKVISGKVTSYVINKIGEIMCVEILKILTSVSKEMFNLDFVERHLRVILS